MYLDVSKIQSKMKEHNVYLHIIILGYQTPFTKIKIFFPKTNVTS